MQVLERFLIFFSFECRKVLFNFFWSSKTEYVIAQIREVNGDLHKVFLCFMFYVRIDYQFKTSEPKNAYVGGANSSRVKVLLEWTGNVQFPVRWSLKEALPSGWGGSLV